MGNEQAVLVTETVCWLGLALGQVISAALGISVSLPGVLVLLVWGGFLYYRKERVR